MILNRFYGWKKQLIYHIFKNVVWKLFHAKFIIFLKCNILFVINASFDWKSYYDIFKTKILHFKLQNFTH